MEWRAFWQLLVREGKTVPRPIERGLWSALGRMDRPQRPVYHAPSDGVMRPFGERREGYEADWIDPMGYPCYPNRGNACNEEDFGSRAQRHRLTLQARITG